MSMDPSTKHPQYWAGYRDWRICRDNYEGQSAMKGKSSGTGVIDTTNGGVNLGTPYDRYKYIKPTSGQILDGMGYGEDGYNRYRSYSDRALHSDFVSDAVDMYLGISWTKAPEINLGMLEELYGDGKPITRQGESILQLYLRINIAQWVAGRIGCLVDLPDSDSVDPTPYVAVYEAECIINWDSGSRQDLDKEHLNLVVLDESGPVRDGFQWNDEEQYRVLWLGDLESNESEGDYSVATWNEGNGNSFVDSTVTIPTTRGNALDEIPFVIINTKSVGSAIEKPPLIGLAYMTTDLLRLDADYKNALHSQGADTLFTKMANDGEVTATGAGAHINIKHPQGDAKFIGVDSSGLPELREAVENGKKMASKKAGELIADDSRDRESASALEQRIGTKTQTLAQLSMTAAEGMQKLLRLIAKWLGGTPAQIAEITVKPNLQFAPKDIDSSAILALSQSAEINPLITLRFMYEYTIKRSGRDISWEDWKTEMAENKILKQALQPEIEAGPEPRESGSTLGSGSTSASS